MQESSYTDWRSQWDSDQEDECAYKDEYVGGAHLSYTYWPYPPVGILSWWMQSEPAQAFLGLDLE